MLGLGNQKLMRLYSVCAYLFVCVFVCARQTGWLNDFSITLFLNGLLLPVHPTACLPALLSFYVNYWLTDHLGDSSDWRCRLSVCHFVCSWTKLKWFALVFKPKRKLISCLHLLWLSSLQRSLLSYCDINLLSPCSVCDDWRIHTINYCQINGYFLFSFWAY